MAQATHASNGPALTLQEYDDRARAANQFASSSDALDQLRFGLFGEVGGILAAVKKSHRDLGPAEQAQVTEELGDSLWYLANVAAQMNLTLRDVGGLALGELQRRLNVAHGQTPRELTFGQFDGLFAFCREQLSALGIADHLLHLGAHAGQLMSTSGAADLASGSPAALLGNILADLALVGALFNVTMTDIAKFNLRKFESRWPPAQAKYRPHFDEGRPAIERLPRVFSVYFIQRFTADGRPYVIQQLNRVNVGDRLTDNRTEADGYRFHDVFHLAYIAHLGWSPVIRALLKLKRKGDPDLDENQDGARAMIIEEGVATWIFNHAHRRNYYDGTQPGKLEYGLLKQVVDMVDGYEVADCPLWQWERAILDGFAVFRQLRDAEGGIVTVDMDKHSISFEKLEGEPEFDVIARPKRSIVASALPPGVTKKS